MRRRFYFSFLLLISFACEALSAEAPPEITEQYYSISIPSQPLIDSINTLSNQTKLLVLYPFDLVAGRIGNAVNGELIAEEALARLLKGTGLKGGKSKTGVLMIVRVETDDNLEKLAFNTRPLPEAVIEEVMITAQKKTEALHKSPISIKVLDTNTLDVASIDGLIGVTRQVPGLSMTDFQRGSNNIQIRGLGSNVGNVGTVAIYNDGVISFNRIQSSGIFAEQDPTLHDVERVEVLRGPQGTLYGEGSFGGVLNIISKPANPEEFESWVSYDRYHIQHGSSDNTKQSFMLNAPLLEDKLAVRFVGFKHDRDGFIDAYNMLPSLNVDMPLPPEFIGEDLNTEKNTGGRLQLNYYGENNQLTLIYRREKLQLGINNYTSPRYVSKQDTLTGQTVRNPSMTLPLFGNEYGSEGESQELMFRADHDFDAGTLVAITGLGEIDRKEADAFSTALDGWSQEIRFLSVADNPLSWIAGVYYRALEKDTELSNSTTHPFRFDELNEWSVYGQMYLDMGNALTLTLGFRYYEQNTRIEDLFNVDLQGNLNKVDARFEDLSPKVSLDWQVDDKSLLYLLVAKGFRAGGASNDYSLGTDANYVERFDPDEIWNYEVGFKQSLFSGRAMLNAAVFYIDWNDVQVDLPIDDLATPNITPGSRRYIPVNGDGAYSRGIEFDAYIKLGEYWDITTGGTYIDAEFTGGEILSPYKNEEHPDGVYQLDGQKLPHSPKYQLNFSIERKSNILQSLEGYVRVDYSLRGPSFSDVPNDPQGASFENSAFEVVNIFAGVRSSHWEIKLYVKNSTNENASTFDWFDGGFDFRARVVPRTTGLSFKLHF